VYQATLPSDLETTVQALKPPSSQGRGRSSNPAEYIFLLPVGHSTGGGEVARYIARHGTSRVAKAVLVSAVPPLMLKTAANPKGTPLAVFDDIREQVFANRAQFFQDFTLPLYGYNRQGAEVSEGVRESFWLQGMLAGITGVYNCIKQFSETDFTEDLKKMTIPTWSCATMTK